MIRLGFFCLMAWPNVMVVINRADLVRCVWLLGRPVVNTHVTREWNTGSSGRQVRLGRVLLHCACR